MCGRERERRVEREEGEEKLKEEGEKHTPIIIMD